MTAPLAHCPSCSKPFAPKREAQRACSPACKQKLFRAEKCNTGHSAPADASDALQRAGKAAFEGGMTRIFGPNRLSEIELRTLKLEPTGLRIGNGSMLYRRTGE